MSDSSGTDSDDDQTKIIFDVFYNETIAEQIGVTIKTTEKRILQLME